MAQTLRKPKWILTQWFQRVSQAKTPRRKYGKHPSPFGQVEAFQVQWEARDFRRLGELRYPPKLALKRHMAVAALGLIFVGTGGAAQQSCTGAPAYLKNGYALAGRRSVRNK
jgi:hypothetical protein